MGLCLLEIIPYSVSRMVVASVSMLILGIFGGLIGGYTLGSETGICAGDGVAIGVTTGVTIGVTGDRIGTLGSVAVSNNGVGDVGAVNVVGAIGASGIGSALWNNSAIFTIAFFVLSPHSKVGIVEGFF